MDQTTWITLAVIGFFVLLALLAFVRLVTRKAEPIWREIRVGFFIERVVDEEESEQYPLRPTTLSRTEP